MSSIDIRHATDSDSPALIDLISSTYKEYPGCVLDVEADEPQLLTPASYYRSKGGRFWVAEMKGGGEATLQIVGSVACLAIPEGLQLYNLYLHPQLRGSGTSRLLIEKVLDFGKETDARKVILWTDTRFERAHRFYENLGFKKGPMVRSLADSSWSVEYFYRLQMKL